MWSVCAPALATAETSALLTLIPELWRTEVNLPRLQEVLPPQYLDVVRTSFAAVVRVCVKDLNALVDLVVNKNDWDDRSLFLQTLRECGLCALANRCWARIVPQQINAFVEKFALKFDEGTVNKLNTFVHDELLPQLSQSLGPESVPVQALEKLALKSLGRLRIRELSYIVEHQEMNGIYDLEAALAQNADLRSEVVSAFTTYCDHLVLNGASDTIDIIQLYLKTISAFSKLDPQGVLLQKVSSRTRQVLQERSDTCANIAEGLFGLSGSPLAYLSNSLSEEDDGSGPKTASRQQLFSNWEPDPLDTPADYVRKLTKDTVSTLINLYDNRGVFVQHLAQLYANELLNAPKPEQLQRLRAHFHRVEQRFGDSQALQRIDVMFADVDRSAKTTEYVRKIDPSLGHMAPLVLSKQYWPQLESANGENSEDEDEMLGRYSAAFKTKYPLELEWLPEHGKVTLEVELADRTLEVAVKPDEAVVAQALATLTDTKSFTLNDLQQMTKMPAARARNALRVWADLGVVGVEEGTDKFVVLETKTENTQAVIVQNEESQGGTDPFEEMHRYWSYIVGMLTNLGALSIDRIHSFLVMFVPSEDPYVRTKQELEAYLLQLVDDGKLTLDDGRFALNASSNP